MCLAEVERRELHLKEGCSSLFSYCVERLGMAEGAAYKRVWAARVGRRFPLVLEMIAEGAIHLTGVHLLARHLTEGNHAALLARAAGKTKREIEKLVAEIAPRPDIPSRVAVLPVRPVRSTSELQSPVAGDCSIPPPPLAAGAGGGSTDGGHLARRAPGPTPTPAIERPAIVQPLAPRRYQIRVTVGEEAHGALRHLQDLMAHEVPDGDPAAIIERALAWERDGGRCAHVDESGRRCTSRRFIELHHRVPCARGGEHTSENLELRCRAHNQFQATLDYGAPFMAARRPDRAREPAAVFSSRHTVPWRSSGARRGRAAPALERRPHRPRGGRS